MLAGVGKIFGRRLKGDGFHRALLVITHPTCTALASPGRWMIADQPTARWHSRTYGAHLCLVLSHVPGHAKSRSG